jgi:MerR family transcriptional regulator, mercuric resistance operon regulatory protein
MTILTISGVARDAGVNVETIRFYQRKGLLSLPAKPLGGIRRYGDAAVARIRFIKSAQRIGFTLEEVAQLLKLDDGTHCQEAKGIAEHKLSEIRHRLADLKRMERLLSELVQCCAASDGQVTCPLISSLRGVV